MKTKSSRIVSIFLAIFMIAAALSACAPRPEVTQEPAAPVESKEIAPETTEAESPEEGREVSTEGETEAVDPEAARYGGTATFVIASDPLNINYNASQGGNIDVQIMMATSDWLTLYNPNTGLYEGRILESWEQSDDSKVWTMKVRDGIKWHDGEPLTAEDVVFTFQYLSDPNLDILDGQPPTTDKVYEVVDRLTYTVTTPQANTSELAEWVNIIPKHIWENVDPANFSKAPEGRLMIGCGPFKMTEYKVGEYIRFDRFDDYYGGKPYLDTIYYRIIGDSTAANAALDSGQVDCVTVDATSAEQMLSNPNVAIWQGPSGNVNRLYFNLSVTHFQDVRVRKAFAHLMQREVYVEQAMRGFADPAYSDFAPTDFYYIADPYKQYDFNIEKAKALLEEAGYVMGDDGIYQKDGEKLEFEVYYTNTAAQAGIAILIMTPVFQEAGIKLTPKIPDDATLNDLWNTHDYVLFNSGTTMGPDPMRYQWIFGTTAVENIMLFENEEIKGLFQSAIASIDEAEVKSIYEQIQKKLADEVVNIPLWYRHTIYAHNKNLVIDEAVPVGYVHFRFLHMEKLYLTK